MPCFYRRPCNTSTQIVPVFAWFRAFEFINLRGGRYHSVPFQMASELALARLFEEETDQRTLFPDDELLRPLLEDFRNLLRQADVGIVDVDWKGISRTTNVHVFFLISF